MHTQPLISQALCRSRVEVSNSCQRWSMASYSPNENEASEYKNNTRAG